MVGRFHSASSCCTTNGLLPDVAELPPQLLAYANVVFANIFYTGAGMAGATVLAKALERRK